MCTLSVIPYEGKLIVTMNRDERRGRAEAINMNIGPDHAYPCDDEMGGTWFGINRQGMIMALLNRYDVTHRAAALSRGRFIPKLLLAHNIDAAIQDFENIREIEENPFDIILISRHEAAHIRWDGAASSERTLSLEAPLLFTSSSEQSEQVLPFREALFEDFIRKRWPDKVTPDMILDHLHLKTIPDMSSSAIFMRRELTHTKSVVQVTLSEADITLSYWAEESIAEKESKAIRITHVIPQQSHFALAPVIQHVVKNDRLQSTVKEMQ